MSANALENLKESYVIVPIDKAANNIGFICKKYYLGQLRKEIASDTYEESPLTPQEVTDQLREESSKITTSVEKT